MLWMPGRSHKGPLPPLSAEEAALSRRLRDHVVALAQTIGERNVFRHAELSAAAGYIERTFGQFGYEPRELSFVAAGKSVANVEAELPGGARRDEIVILGAHYDTVPGSPGANDNATGVAALLEIARGLRGRHPARTVRFVAFVNEEPPFYRTDEMGSRFYASGARARGDRIAAMISLETIGYYADVPGTQSYPFPLGLFYPDRGNFIGFVGNLRSRGLVRRCVGSFRRHTAFPSEAVAVPGTIPGIGWSDHWSFWKEGYPGVMVTDTALYRYLHYHRPEDTPDKVDYDRLARVTGGLSRMLAELSEGAPAGGER
jgi:Zn-dependent M28 family amino/carboxypeptidase